MVWAGQKQSTFITLKMHKFFASKWVFFLTTSHLISTMWNKLWGFVMKYNIIKTVFKYLISSRYYLRVILILISIMRKSIKNNFLAYFVKYWWINKRIYKIERNIKGIEYFRAHLKSYSSVSRKIQLIHVYIVVAIS